MRFAGKSFLCYVSCQQAFSINFPMLVELIKTEQTFALGLAGEGQSADWALICCFFLRNKYWNLKELIFTFLL